MTDVTKRNKANRRKGAVWQVDLLEYLRGKGLDVEQLHLRGKNDEGDHAIRNDGLGGPPTYLVIEAKNADIDLGGFIRQAEVEVENFRRHRGLERWQVDVVVILKRRGVGPGQAYVITTVDRYFGFDEEVAAA